MAKIKEEVIVEHLIPTTLEEIMGDRFGRYSKYIIQERALPDARDGLKPVQRRILYAMYHDGNHFDKQHRKSAKTVGLVIGNYHPHGDSSVYEAMVRLSQNWKVRELLVDMHGNNGSIDDDPAAAMRYTEARMSKISGSMCTDLDQDTVLFTPNFDDTELEPTVLPTRFPTLLVNGATGIAAGYATNIPPHNISEVIDATIYKLKHNNATIDDLMQIIKGPDFPTGGIVMGVNGLKDAYTNGKGKCIIRSICEIVETKSCNQIVITQIPYEVIKSNLVKKMDDIRLDKDIEGMLDVRDESDRNGLKVVVDLKKDNDAQLILNYLYKNTDLQVAYNFNMIGIINKRPIQMSLINMLDAFIEFRQEVVLRRSKFQLDKWEKRCHILAGLMRAVSIMDEIIKIIRSAKDKADAKEKLQIEFKFSEQQAEAIVILRLYRLTSTDIFSLKSEYEELTLEMERLKAIIANSDVLNKVIISELLEIKKTFGNERRSSIQQEIEEIIIDKTMMIVNEKVMITSTYDGYIKRVSLRSYNASDKVLTKIKDGDKLVGVIECETLDTLLIITNLGNYAYIPVYQVDDFKWKDIGNHFNTYVKCSANEKVINVFVVKEFKTNASIVTVSKNGFIKKSMVDMWQVSRTSKVMVAQKIKKDDELISASIAYSNDDIAIITKDGYCSRYNIDENVSNTALRSQGVKAINLAKDDYITGATIVNKNSNEVIIVCEKGYMKRIKATEFKVATRPAKGELVAKKIKSNPYITKHIIAKKMQDNLMFVGENVEVVLVKDISLMSKESSYSSVLNIKESFNYVQGINAVNIIEISDEINNLDNTEIIDNPTTFVELDDSDVVRLEDLEEAHNDFEMFTLFDD